MAASRKALAVLLTWLACALLPAQADTLVVCSAAADKSLVVFRFDPTRGSLTELSRQVLTGEPAALLPSPDGRTLFVTLRSTGQLTSLRVDGSTGRLTPLRVVDAGADPAQITLDKNGQYLLTAYYGAGKISAHRVLDDGSLSEKPAWEIPTREKAHAVSLDHAGQLLVVPHTGPDTIFQFRYQPDGRPAAPLPKPRVDLPPGTGPRHAAWHPKHPIVYINNEQGSSVSAYRSGPDGLRLIEGSTVSTLPAGFQGSNSTAEIAIHGGGRMLVVANRGHDSLALIRVDESGTKLTPVGHHKTEKTPRSFCFDPFGRYVFTAGESSGFLEVSKAMPRQDNGAAESLKPLGRLRVGEKLWWVTAFESPVQNGLAFPNTLKNEPDQPGRPASDRREETWWKWPLTSLPFLGSLGALLGYRKRLRLARLMEDLPTSKAHGVFIGLVQVEGTAEAEEPLTTYMEGKLCVHHAWHVQEEWRRTVTVTKTDSNGKTYTETKTESGWTTVAEGGGSIPFYLRDDSGTVRVCPNGAQIESQTVFNVTCGTDSDLYFGLGPNRIIPNSTQRRRFFEQAIPLHAPITVVGQSRVRDDVAAPEIAADKAAPLFLITTRNEKQVLGSFRWARVGFLVLGSVLVSGGVFLWHVLSGNKPGTPGFNPWIFAPALAAFWCLALVMYAWQMFNSMVDLRNRTDRAWSLIDIELKRRADLLPPLIACVQGINRHESQVQQNLARLRAQASASPNEEVMGLSGGLKALVEAYPQLTANRNNAELMSALADTENRIAMAREYYNDQVVWHNIRVERIPDFLFAWLAGLTKRHPFLATDLEREEVEVNLHE
jgi:6-phosphogluconolactonase (cycloisomerase 2 family)